MHDPFEFVKTAVAATVAAAVASALIVIGFRVVMRNRTRLLSDVCCVVALGAGLLAGNYVLKISWTWPPVNALDRFLTIVLPAGLIVELLAAIAASISDANNAASDECKTTFEARYSRYSGILIRSGNQILIVARLLLFAFAGRILLHESVYLNEASDHGWSKEEQFVILITGTIVLVSIWFGLTRLSQRAPPISILLSLSMAIFSAGGATMMALYIKGGTAALPLASALLGATLASPLLMHSDQTDGTHSRSNLILNGTIGVGVVGLFSLLWIGRFFGQLTNLNATVIFFAPILCWSSELPLFRSTTAQQKTVLRLIAVAIPLALVLWIAKKEFDKKLPLLADVSTLNFADTNRFEKP